MYECMTFVQCYNWGCKFNAFKPLKKALKISKNTVYIQCYYETLTGGCTKNKPKMYNWNLKKPSKNFAIVYKL